MTLDDVKAKYEKTINAILKCGPELHESALILLYAAIDSLSWLDSEQANLDDRNVAPEYKKWVQDFLLPELKNLGYDCTEDEIYYARCGYVHTYSALAKKQRNNRILVYGLGERQDTLVKLKSQALLAEKITGKKFIPIHIGDLVTGFIEATHKFFKQVEENHELLIRVINKADKYYAPLDERLFIDLMGRL